MFFNSNDENNKSGSSFDSKSDHETRQLAYLAAGIFAAAILGGSGLEFENFYARNFRFIWMSAWVAALVLIYFGLRFFVKRWKMAEKEGLTYEHLKYTAKGDQIFVAQTSSTSLVLSQKQRLGHVQILGSTGRGKTESVIIPWIVRDALSGSSSILIDGKGDPELALEISSALHGKVLVEVFDLSKIKDSAIMNPLAFGSAQEVTDRIFASFDFEDSFYKAVQYDLALGVISALKSTGEELTFKKLHSLLVSDLKLSALAKSCTDIGLKAKLQKIIATPRQQREQNQMGLVTQLAPFAEGELSGFLNGTKENPNRCLMEFRNILLNDGPKSEFPKVYIVLLPTLKYQTSAKRLGKMLLQEIASLVGERSSLGGSVSSFASVYLDEFSAFAFEGFEQILNKARSSKVAIHLSHQSMADLSLVSEDFARVVNTNTNVKCLLGLNDPDTADFYARHLGTRPSERRTEKVEDRGIFKGSMRTGQGSVREVEEYKIHPNDLKNFVNGIGVLHLPTPDGNFTAKVQFARLTAKERAYE